MKQFVDAKIFATGANEGADYETAISAAGFGKFQLYLLVITGLIYTNTAIGITIVSFVLPAATCDFRMTSADKGWLAASPMLGMVIGSYFWGCLADTRGRKVVLVTCLMLDGSVGIISSFVQILPIFMVCRIVNGFAIAGAMGICFSYLGEFQQTKYRVKILSWMEIFWTLGAVLMPLIAWSIIPLTGIRIETNRFSYDSWNWFVSVCAVPSLLLGFLMMTFPESPKFMMEVGDYDDAIKALKRIYKQNTGDDPENYPIKSLIKTRKAISVIPESSAKSVRSLNLRKREDLMLLLAQIWIQTKAICKTPHRKYTILTSLIQFGLNTSYYTLTLWFPEIFNRYEVFERHYPNTRASLSEISAIDIKARMNDPFECSSTINDKVYIHTLIVGLSCIPTSLWLPLCVHKLGVRFFLVFSLGGAGVVAIGLYFVKSATQNLVLSCIFEPLTSLASSILFCVLVDLFPTNLRVMAAALTLTIGRGGGLIGDLSFGYLVDFNFLVSIILFGSLLFIAAFLCLFLPKTGQEALN